MTSFCAAFLGELTELHGTIVGMAERIGAYEKVPLELAYYKSKVLDYSQYLFVLSFLLMARITSYNVCYTKLLRAL